jgi:uncharacterized RDD family membrane protein YckC
VFCSKCGSAIADGATFCNKCGLATYTASAPIATAASTPSVLTLNRPYAGFWLRLLAHLIDGVILAVFLVPIIVGTAMLMGLAGVISSLPRGRDPFGEGFPPVFAEFFVAVFLVSAGASWLYYALLESSDWQGTAGKKALGLEVTDMTGAKVSFGRASGRFFGRFVTQLIPLGFGFILAGITEKKQALHDMISGCLVLRRT